MKFLGDNMAEQLADSHPELSALLRDFETWSHKQGLPEPVVVELWRSAKEQGDLYVGIWRQQAKQALASKAPPRAAKLRALEIHRMSDKELRGLAEQKFSWHVCRCAVDLRTRHYTREQMLEVVKWFQERCPKPMWELVTEKHGTGAHIHCGRRDFSWRKKFTQTPEVPNA
jgi:hypothetical protein